MDRLDYIIKWRDKAYGKSKKKQKEFWDKELARWEAWLWLGRHYWSRENHVFDDTPGDIVKQAYIEAEKIEKEYENDPEFIEYMCERKTAESDEEFGDTCWREISMNVGALRWLLCGDWFLDS